ncbi:angiotensinogen [Hypanus sabinus]|uniref:angiotensinogen n=1 Tax=Hypanus sabinus TaxID=79690 RepID=UPI0028C4E9CB|nr:angiotensinogen [Hypanus sabinus]
MTTKWILTLLWIGTLVEVGAGDRPYIHPFFLIICNQSESSMQVDGEEDFLPELIGDNDILVNGSWRMWWEEEEEEQVKPSVQARNYLYHLQASLGHSWLSHWTSQEGSGVTVLSPMYLQVVLAALSLGADGSTLDNLQMILGLSHSECGGSSSGDQHSLGMRQQLWLLLRNVLAQHHGSLSIGTWMIFQDRIWLRRTFTEHLRLFHPEVWLGATDFSQPPLAEESINNVIRRATGGRLNNLVTGLNPSTKLVVASFIHFKGKWKTRSQCHGTELHDFFNDSGDKAQVPMTTWCGWLQYKTTPEYTLIKLPLSETMYMILIQTVQPATVEKIAQMLAVYQTLKHFQTGFVRLVMPQFAWKSTYDVKEQFSQTPDTLGAEANFSRLSRAQNVVPEQVLHSVIFEVTEDEEEQITAEDLDVGNITTIEIRFNKPFFFRVYDGASNALLFLGRVKEFPLKSELKNF